MNSYQHAPNSHASHPQHAHQYMPPVSQQQHAQHSHLTNPTNAYSPANATSAMPPQNMTPSAITSVEWINMFISSQLPDAVYLLETYVRTSVPEVFSTFCRSFTLHAHSLYAVHRWLHACAEAHSTNQPIRVPSAAPNRTVDSDGLELSVHFLYLLHYWMEQAFAMDLESTRGGPSVATQLAVHLHTLPHMLQFAQYMLAIPVLPGLHKSLVTCALNSLTALNTYLHACQYDPANSSAPLHQWRATRCTTDHAALANYPATLPPSAPYMPPQQQQPPPSHSHPHPSTIPGAHGGHPDPMYDHRGAYPPQADYRYGPPPDVMGAHGPMMHMQQPPYGGNVGPHHPGGPTFDRKRQRPSDSPDRFQDRNTRRRSPPRSSYPRRPESSGWTTVTPSENVSVPGDKCTDAALIRTQLCPQLLSDPAHRSTCTYSLHMNFAEAYEHAVDRTPITADKFPEIRDVTGGDVFHPRYFSLPHFHRHFQPKVAHEKSIAEAHSSHPEWVLMLPLPAQESRVLGTLMGPRGERIRELHTRSGCSILTMCGLHDRSPMKWRHIYAVGTQEALQSIVQIMTAALHSLDSGRVKDWREHVKNVIHEQMDKYFELMPNVDAPRIRPCHVHVSGQFCQQGRSCAFAHSNFTPTLRGLHWQAKRTSFYNCITTTECVPTLSTFYQPGYIAISRNFQFSSTEKQMYNIPSSFLSLDDRWLACTPVPNDDKALKELFSPENKRLIEEKSGAKLFVRPPDSSQLMATLPSYLPAHTHAFVAQWFMPIMIGTAHAVGYAALAIYALMEQRCATRDVTLEQSQWDRLNETVKRQRAQIVVEEVKEDSKSYPEIGSSSNNHAIVKVESSRLEAAVKVDAKTEPVKSQSVNQEEKVKSESVKSES